MELSWLSGLVIQHAYKGTKPPTATHVTTPATTAPADPENSVKPPHANDLNTFVLIYTEIREVLNEQFSLLTLRDELNVKATCKFLLQPYQQNIQQLMLLINLKTDFNNSLSQLTQRTLDRCAVGYFTTVNNAPTYFKNNGFGEYTLQQIRERHITFQQAQKLNNFIKEYNAELSSDPEAHAKLAERLRNDADLAKYFSPGHVCWPLLHQLKRTNSDQPVLDLELALLLSSAGVQKYFSDDPQAFYGEIIRISQNKFRELHVDHIKYCLDLFNNSTIQEYIDNKHVSTSVLIMHARTADFGNRVEALKDPITKQYFDEGFFFMRNYEEQTFEDIFFFTTISDNLLFILSSPVIRSAYEKNKKDCTMLYSLQGYFETTTDRAVPYNFYEKRLLEYITEGILDYKQFKALTKEQREDLAMWWVKGEIKGGNHLTMEDVLARSPKFYLRWLNAKLLGGV